MSSTNSVRLSLDANAGRFDAAKVPQYRPGQDVGEYLLRLGKALQDAEDAKAKAFRDVQRAFQQASLQVEPVEVQVMQDWAVNASSTNVTNSYITLLVLGTGGTNSSNISGTNCT